MIIGETVLTTRLWDNATARGLLTLFPITLARSDFNNLEKFASEGMPSGDDPLPTGIGHYVPSG